MALVSFGQFSDSGALADESVCEGNNVSFMATYNDADNGGTVFEWVVDGNTLTGTSGTVAGITYTISSALTFSFPPAAYIYQTNLTITSTTTSFDNYSVRAEETNSSDATSDATLFVNANPSITAIADVTVCHGGNAVFATDVSGGDGSYDYTWTRYTGSSTVDFDDDGGVSASAGTINGTISGATTDITNSDIGIVVTDGNGCTASSTPTATVLTVAAAPTITAQPDATATFCSGSDVTLTVAANDASTYSWSDGSIEVGTAASYTATAAGTYTVTVGNTGCTSGAGAVVSTSSAVSASPTLAVSDPAAPNIPEGGSGSTSVTYTSGANTTVTWFVNGEALTTASTVTTGGTAVSISAAAGTSQIDFTGVTAADVGASVSVTVSDDCGTVNSAPTVLPVELAYIKGQKVGNTVVLSWQTLSEINNYGFEVEKSIDGKTFNLIGFVEGAGNSVNALDYSFIDETPTTGMNYYRLRQVDLDGAFTYTEVVSVDFDGETAPFTLNINPTASSNQVQITLSEAFDKDLNVEIYDALGRKVMNTSIRMGENVLPLNISTFTKGQYFVRLYNSDNTVTKTFFKL